MTESCERRKTIKGVAQVSLRRLAGMVDMDKPPEETEEKSLSGGDIRAVLSRVVETRERNQKKSHGRKKGLSACIAHYTEPGWTSRKGTLKNRLR